MKPFVTQKQIKDELHAELDRQGMPFDARRVAGRVADILAIRVEKMLKDAVREARKP